MTAASELISQVRLPENISKHYFCFLPQFGKTWNKVAVVENKF